MGTTLKRVASLLVVCSVSVAMAGPASAVITDPQRAHRAMGYVGAQQQRNGSFPGFSAIGSTADAVLDMAATGYGDEVTAIAYLRNQVRRGNVSTVGLTAKVVMAAVAAGHDPSTFAGTNLLGHLTDAAVPEFDFHFATVYLLDERTDETMVVRMAAGAATAALSSAYPTATEDGVAPKARKTPIASRRR